MMSRFAFVFSVWLLGTVTFLPQGGLLWAQEQQAQPTQADDLPQKPDPVKAEQPDPKVPAPKEIPDVEQQTDPFKPDPAKAEPPESDVPTPKDTPDVEPAEQPDLSGFERINAFQKKWMRLNEFLRKIQGELTEATPNLEERPSPVVDETVRLMRVLDLNMLREARQIYDQALQAENPETRNQLLRRLVELETITPLSDVTSRAEELLTNLTVNGKIYPTLEEARAARQKLKQDERKKLGEISEQYRSELDDVKAEQLTDDLIKAEKQLKEKDAREILETAVRLVVPQRREQLQQLLQNYPDTQAAAQAQTILNALNQRDEMIARRKLREALCAPLVFDQRWRRLKELVREYPRTIAAVEAEQIFFQHALQVPSMTIANQTPADLDITVDVPYEKCTQAQLGLGEMQSFSSVFPMMVRVRVSENEWDVYQALPGLDYILQIRHDQRHNVPKPVLVPAPAVEPLPGNPLMIPMPSGAEMPPIPMESPTPGATEKPPMPMITPTPEMS